jgi:hypothetical protein
MAEVIIWQHDVPPGHYMITEYGPTDENGNPTIRNTCYLDTPLPVYVDVELFIGGHAETYRVHANYTGSEVLEFTSVEELTK